ncbi:uncharacterized protein LOC113207486 [Frankliniella occidentalis]|uniref:Uncharacterized protein LOC113207486 n=1 Tax=Frankliniella occidentalis TaxID=133901 RepID=A0A6J1SFS8_FRAOC|nr:uncharacterized protein LOC113207486 [Frankliniella occidentalis]
MEQLPDDVLVMTLKYVAVNDVFTCRLVCKRLCSLALHRDVWRHRAIQDDDRCAGAVLRLAPCLDTLRVTGDRSRLAAATTRCAVARLELTWSHPHSFRDAERAEYALIVRNQESLGRLRILVLRILDFGEQFGPFKQTSDILYRTVASCSGLKSLVVVFRPTKTTHPIVYGLPSSSLTYFSCAVDDHSASFVNTILAGHAATLEGVRIDTDSDLRQTTTANLLAAMPRLRSLQCDGLFCGLEVVAECKTLREVDIYLQRRTPTGDGNVVAKFLRRASQLRRVRLDNIMKTVAEQWPVLVEAFEALASSGRSQLERLALSGFQELRPLIRALPSLPTLRHLGVGRDPDDVLLKSITPFTAPALKLLEITVAWDKCPHDWIHRDAVKAALTANPLLHIKLSCNAVHRSVPPKCETCEEACHAGVNWHDVKKIGVYTHDPGTCPSPEAHTDAPDWVRTYERPIVLACTWIHM